MKKERPIKITDRRSVQEGSMMDLGGHRKALRKEYSRRGVQCAMMFHMGGCGHSDSVFLSSLKSVLTSGQFPVLVFILFLINLFLFWGSAHKVSATYFSCEVSVNGAWKLSLL